MAEPIVQQTLAGDGAAHQSLLDQLHGVLDGAWKWIEAFLPEHELKGQALDGIKAVYDNGAKAIKDDYATLKAQGTELADTVVSDLKQDATTVVGQAEAVVGDVASAVASGNPSSTSSTISVATPSGGTSSGTSTGSASDGTAAK